MSTVHELATTALAGMLPDYSELREYLAENQLIPDTVELGSPEYENLIEAVEAAMRTAIIPPTVTHYPPTGELGQ